MFTRQYDIVCIGDVASDAFIRLKDAHINCKIDKHNCEICFPFGDKVPFEYTKIIKGVGNAANAAVASARMGLHTALISNVGDDQNGRDCRVELEQNKVNISYVKVNKDKPSNYHFVLWYDVDRTILVNHVEYDYRLPKFPNPKWIYLTSLGRVSTSYYKEISDYLNNNPKVKLAFQPGSQQIRLGYHELEFFYKRADVFIVNLEEAEKILITTKFSGPNLKNDPKSMLKYFGQLGPKLIVITDGPNGAYMFDGEHYYHMPIYPDPRPPVERTGCGDAWASTFVAALTLGRTPLEALVLAPINPMSVAQYIGSQQGLLKLDDMNWWLEKAPESYKPKEV
jgi:sugar/nucleoside kinase (ribokinase family)